MSRLRNSLPLLFVIASAVALVIFKWPHLALPAYWDEGFPYVYGIRYLHDHHLTLLPNGMPPLYSTGHPTLFYFLAASWMRIFGTGIFTAHLFPLLVSVILLFAVYRFGKMVVSPWAGAMAAFLLCTRTIFLAQSSFLLPEILLALFALLTFQSWLLGKRKSYFIWGSLLLLTKEPGLVLIAVLGAIELAELLHDKEKKPHKKLLHLLVTASPVLPAVLFFIVQRIQMGWFFFPRHINSFHTTAGAFSDKLVKGFGSHFFIYYGGIVTTAIVFASAVFLLLKKIKLPALQQKMAIASILMIFAYLVFFSFSFPIQRYMLLLYGPWFVTVILLLITVMGEAKKTGAFAILFVAGIIQLGYAYDVRSLGDYDLGYMDVVKTQQEAVRWCIENDYRQKKIFSQQQLERGMKSDAAGFVNAQELFTDVSNSIEPGTSLFIFTCTESDPSDQQARRLPLKKAARFEHGKAWTEIYTRDTSSAPQP